MKEYREVKNILVDLEHKGKISLSGKWQGNDDFHDEKMFVLRNITLKHQLSTKEKLRDFSGADQPWSEMHFLERINGIPSNPGDTYKFWPYANFDKDNDPYLKGKKFSHTYQERFWPKQANGGVENYLDSKGDWNHKGIRFEYGDLEDVISTLKNNPLTRQAYLPIWFPEDTWAANNSERVPCTLGYYFWIEEGKLYMNYTIRSCDAFRHFRNDIYLTGRLLLYVAKQLNLQVGEMTMIIYNIHLFINDIYPFRKKEFMINNLNGKNYGR